MKKFDIIDINGILGTITILALAITYSYNSIF